MNYEELAHELEGMAQEFRMLPYSRGLVRRENESDESWELRNAEADTIRTDEVSAGCDNAIRLKEIVKEIGE